MINKFNFANMVLNGVSRSISVHPQRCTRIMHKSSGCTLCHANCPVDAIKVGSPGMTINVDWDKCSGCGICVNLCPNGAYTLRNSGYKQIIDNSCMKITDNNCLTINCKEANKIVNSATLECIGILSFRDILLLYLRGASKIAITCGDCTECSSKHGATILKRELNEIEKLATVFEDLKDLEIVQSLNNIEILFSKKHEIIRPVEEEKPNPILDRRGIFGYFKQSMKDNALKTASMMSVEQPEPRTILKFEKIVPSKRKLFLDIIMKLGRLECSEVATDKNFNNIEIDPSCVFCGMCARFCPTGALLIDEDRTIITFNAAKCSSCLLCAKACYHTKLKYSPTLTLNTFFDDIILAKKEKPDDIAK